MFELNAEQRELRERARELADSRYAPLASRWDENEECPEENHQLLGEEGFLGLTFSAEFGGQRPGTFEAWLVLEEISRGCQATAMALQLSVNGPPRAIASLGTDEQKRRLRPGVVNGSRLFSIAMPEPQAGSDGTNLHTPARGDDYRLTGTKCYITGAARADSYLVFRRAEGTVGSRGIGAVIMERPSEGFSEPEVERKLGGRGVAEAVLRFDDVWIPQENVLIGPEPDSRRGADVLLTQFHPEQLRQRGDVHRCRPGGIRRGRRAGAGVGTIRPTAHRVPGAPVEGGRHGARPGGRRVYCGVRRARGAKGASPRLCPP